MVHGERTDRLPRLQIDTGEILVEAVCSPRSWTPISRRYFFRIERHLLAVQEPNMTAVLSRRPTARSTIPSAPSIWAASSTRPRIGGGRSPNRSSRGTRTPSSFHRGPGGERIEAI